MKKDKFIKDIVDIIWKDCDDESIYCKLNKELSGYEGNRDQIEQIFDLCLKVFQKNGMNPPLNELGIELACTSDHDNRDIGYVTKKFLTWDK